MFVSGVDVDFLNDREILELCSDVADTDNNEISVLNDIDVNNLSDDKIQDIYDNVIYGSQNLDVNNEVIPITEQQTLDLNYYTVDMDADEIVLLNGYNAGIDINDLSDEEISSLYDEALLSPYLISATKNLYNCTADDITQVYGDSYKLKVTCKTTDTSISDSGYLTFYTYHYGYDGYSFSTMLKNAINSGDNGSPSCYSMYAELAYMGNNTTGIAVYVLCYGYYYDSSGKKHTEEISFKNTFAK